MMYPLTLTTVAHMYSVMLALTSAMSTARLCGEGLVCARK